MKIEEIKERIRVLENNENEEEYDEMLDECGLDTSVYPASMVLKKVDEIAYRCGFSDYNDSELCELQEELEELEEVKEDGK